MIGQLQEKREARIAVMEEQPQIREKHIHTSTRKSQAEVSPVSRERLRFLHKQQLEMGGLLKRLKPGTKRF